MSTRKSSNEGKFKNVQKNTDGSSIASINIAKNTRSKHINFTKIYNKNIKMDAFSDDQIIIIDKEDYMKGIDSIIQENSKDKHRIKDTRSTIKDNTQGKQIQQNNIDSYKDKECFFHENQGKNKKGKKNMEKNKKKENNGKKKQTYFNLDESQEIYDEEQQNTYKIQEQKMKNQRSRKKYVQEEMKFSQCMFAEELVQKHHSTIKMDDLKLLEKIEIEKREFANMQYSLQQIVQEKSILSHEKQDKITNVQKIASQEIRQQQKDRDFDSKSNKSIDINQNIENRLIQANDNESQGQNYERNPSKKIKMDDSMQKEYNEQSFYPKMIDLLDQQQRCESMEQGEHIISSNKFIQSIQSPINNPLENKSQPFIENNQQILVNNQQVLDENHQIFVDIQHIQQVEQKNQIILQNNQDSPQNNQQQIQKFQKKKTFGKQQLLSLINEQNFKLSQLMNAEHINNDQTQYKDLSIIQTKRNKQFPRNKGLYSTCNQCKLNRQYNYLLSEIFNELLDDDLELNFDQIFLEQETLSILSCLSPNQFIYQNGKVHYNIDKIADISDNKILCAMIANKKVSEETQFQEILGKFKLAKIVKTKIEWICILRVRQLFISRQEHFKYIPAQILAKSHRNLVKTFLFR